MTLEEIISVNTQMSDEEKKQLTKYLVEVVATLKGIQNRSKYVNIDGREFRLINSFDKIHLQNVTELLDLLVSGQESKTDLKLLSWSLDSTN